MDKKTLIELNLGKLQFHFSCTQSNILIPYKDDYDYQPTAATSFNWATSYTYKSEYITYEDWVEYNKLINYKKEFDTLIHE